MKKKFRIGLRVSPLKGRSKKYFQKALLSFISRWLRWRKHEENRDFHSIFSSIKLIGAPGERGKSTTEYFLSYTVDIGGYTSQLFYIKDVRYYEKEI